MSDGDRDRRIVRRALIAGGIVAVALGALFSAVAAGAGAGVVASGLWLGLAVGGFVASIWLLLALGLDLAAREHPSIGRLIWTAAVCIVTLLLPFLAFAAGTATAP